MFGIFYYEFFGQAQAYPRSQVRRGGVRHQNVQVVARAALSCRLPAIKSGPGSWFECEVRISVATAQTLVLILDDAVATVGSFGFISRLPIAKRETDLAEVLSFRWKGWAP